MTKKYRYNCRATPFGCLSTRCRKEGIEYHESKCPLMKKYKSYIEAKDKVPLLEKQIEKLQLQLDKIGDGHCRLKLEYDDWREFHKELLSDKSLQLAWEKLFAGQKRDGIEAMIVLYLAKSKRFWKISQCKQFVEVKGYFGSIRTFNKTQTLEMGDFASCLYSELAYYLEDNLVDLGYKDESRFAKAFHLDKMIQVDSDNKHATCFVRDALYNEVRRRRKGGPVTYKNNSIVLPQKKEKPERRTISI